MFIVADLVSLTNIAKEIGVMSYYNLVKCMVCLFDGVNIFIFAILSGLPLNILAVDLLRVHV